MDYYFQLEFQVQCNHVKARFNVMRLTNGNISINEIISLENKKTHKSIK